MSTHRLRVLVLTDNLASNCLGRAYLLAELLEADYDVRVAGPIEKNASIWAPCPTDDIPVEAWCRHQPSFAELLRQAACLDADVVVASKLLQNSYGLALLARRRRSFPLVLDIDDWDLVSRGRPSIAKLLRSIPRPWKWYRFWEVALDRLAHRADAITVATKFLQKRYGGELLPHVRDCHRLDPDKWRGLEVRRDLGLEGKKIVLFLGTPRRHKGVEDAAAAVEALGRDDVRFLVVGASPGDPYVQELHKRFPSVLLHPPCKWSEAPAFLAASDVVVVPQRKTPFSQAQLPAKLIDAMAMGKPTVATAVSDIPALLEGCGKVVPPGNVRDLASAIRWVIKNPGDAAEMGGRARDKAVRELSYEAGREILLRAVRRAMARFSMRSRMLAPRDRRPHLSSEPATTGEASRRSLDVT